MSWRALFWTICTFKLLHYFWGDAFFCWGRGPPDGRYITENCEPRVQMASSHQNPSAISALSRRYKNLLNSEKFVDCSFTVEQAVIKCHKLILSAASPVFEAMFYGPMSNDRSIEILDISPETFRLMLQYIYTSEVDFENECPERIFELYYSAEKYILPDLARLCLNAIKVKIRYQNILPALDLSVHMGFQPLQEICFNFFSKCCLDGWMFRHAFKTYYYHVSRECIKMILHENRNCDYPFLGWFIREWCKTECKNLELEEADYDTIVAKIDIPELKKFLTIQPSEEVRLPTNTRYMTCNYAERAFFKACRPFVVTNTTSEIKTTIKTNKFISLLGVVVSSRLMPRTMPENSEEYRESVNVEVSCDNHIIHREETYNQNVNYNCDLNINLHPPVVLSPDVEYLIKFSWGNDAYGAEYPASLFAFEAGGISYFDRLNNPSEGGGILRGIKYLNLS